MKNYNTQDTNDEGAIGIGAMIVFIALILVAAVASAVIIQTGEKLQQNAQKTGDDTSNSMSGKLMITGAFVATDGDWNILVMLAPGSSPVLDQDVLAQMFCGTTAFNLRGDAFNAITDIGGTGLTANTLATGVGYILDISPNAACTAGVTGSIFLHIKGAGSTYETFTVTTTDGASLV